MELISTINWGEIATPESIQRSINALTENNINTFLVKNREAAISKVFELIPEGVEVMDMLSVTLKELEISKVIKESGRYKSVKVMLKSMNRETQNAEMQKLGAAPLWAIGSVHAITEDGRILIASYSGSQLPAYAYGSSHVIWIAGAQKIVKNIEEGFNRIHEYCWPLEDERVRKATDNKEGSAINKILVINKEIKKNRINLILIPEKIGF